MLASVVALLLALHPLLLMPALPVRAETTVMAPLAPLPPVPELPFSVGTTEATPLSPLAWRLQQDQSAVTRDATGRAVTIFGLPADEARILLLPVDRQRALPEGYQPPDLEWVGGRLVRAYVRPDLLAMIEAADAEGIELVPISAHRGPEEQALAFESAVWGAIARADGEIDRAEAESTMARFVAPPGHSQHQLGTAVDFSTWEVNYALQPRFADTEAGRWLEAHAWEYGFVVPYTLQGEERTGYGYEPWHFRWIGRALAAVLHHDGYLHHPTLIVDDYLRAAEELMAYEGIQ